MIPPDIIKELVTTETGGPITDPLALYFIGIIPDKVAKLIKAKSGEVYISKKSLKHVIDRHGVEMLFEIPIIIFRPTKVTPNHAKRNESFIFSRVILKPKGVVIEVGAEKPDDNRAVSAFPISPKTYRKMKDISGGTAPA